MSFVARPLLPLYRAGNLPVVAIGLLALALGSARAQQDAGVPPQPAGQPQQPDQTQQPDQDDDRDIGWIYGVVTGPAGVLENGGAVSLSTDGGRTLRYNMTVSPKGDYTGRVPLGEYTLIYREPGTPEGRATDFIHSVVILAGKGTEQNVDMTRQAYIDRLSPEERAQLRQIIESNQKAAAANKGIAAVSADLEKANRDFLDVAAARTTAVSTLDATASVSDVDSEVAEIRVSKYTEIESLMTQATADLPADPTVWIYLGRAQLGLKNYLDAETSFKKAVDLTAQAANPSPQAPNIAPQAANTGPQAANPGPQAASIDPQLAAAAQAGLGEVYARTRMVDEADASFAAAAKADPAHAATYLRNLAVIFFQEKNTWAQVDAAGEAIKANPQDPLLYFIKAQGLAIDAPLDPDTNKLKLSPECVAAFQKYLELAPTGDYAAQVTTILESAGLENADPQTTTPQTAAPQNAGP